MLPGSRAHRSRRPALHHLDTGGGRWGYACQGQGPPVLLIHGLSGSVHWWRRNMPAFARHFTVYAVELAGFASNRGRPLAPDASARSLAGFMDTLALERAHIVGHSLGGQISLHLAAAFPHRVQRLALAAPSGLIRRGLARMALRLPRALRHSPVLRADYHS